MEQAAADANPGSGLYFDEYSNPAQRKKTAKPLDQHSEFLRLLAVAQDTELDFLPFKWQPALERIGAGGTAEVRQSLINLQTSFAFKRLNFSARRSANKGRALALLVSEMLVLGHRRIRDHPYITRLEAVCWDIAGSGAGMECWPVLVFEKSQDGDLLRFLDASRDSPLDMGIIHGDVKPANMLVYKDVDGSHVTKLSDFGYSGIVQDTELIRLPQSKPFSAPEYRDQGVEFNEARKQDIFCLGMSCLWILFYDKLVDASQEFGDDTERIIRGRLDFDLLENRKLNQMLTSLALQLVDRDDRLSKRQKGSVAKFLTMALSHNPSDRELDVAILADFVGHRKLLVDDSNEEVISRPHRSFNLINYLSQLYIADYRVRKYIFEAFQRQTLDHHCDKCALDNSAQLALCYTIGFGVNRDEGKALEILRQFDKDEVFLKAQIEAARLVPFEYKNKQLAILQSQGLIRPHNQTDEYRTREKLLEAEIQCRREVSDVAEAFGENDDFTTNLQILLARIMVERGNYDGAEQLLCKLRASSEDLTQPSVAITIYAMLGDVHHRQGRFKAAEDMYREASEPQRGSNGNLYHHPLVIMNNLTTVLRERGKYKEADVMSQSVLRIWEQSLGKEHPLTLGMMSNRATVLEEMGDVAGCESLQLEAYKGMSRALGPKHPNTLTCLINLGGKLRDQGRFDEAEKAVLKALEGRRLLYGADHPDTLAATSSLAMILHDRGRYSEADAMAQQALQSMKRALKEDHADTLQLQENLALMFRSVGKFDTAEQILRQILGDVETLLGAEHPRTLSVRAHIALVLIDLGIYDEAESAGRAVWATSKHVLGERHPKTLAALNDLALALRHQLKYEEAATLNQQVLDGRQETLGDEHPDTLNSRHNLGTLLVLQQDYERATLLLEDTLECRTRLLGEQHPDTLHTMTSLASIHCFKKQYDMAEEGYCRALNGFTHVLGEEHPTTLTCANNVAIVLQRKGEFAEAERWHRKVLHGRTAALGPDHPDTLSAKNNLSAVLLSLGQYDPAASEASDALEGHTRIYGVEHPSTLSSLSYLATIRLYQERYDEGAAIHRQAFEGRARVLGIDHPDTATSFQKLMEILIFLDRANELDQALSMVLEDMELHDGDENDDNGEKDQNGNENL